MTVPAIKQEGRLTTEVMRAPWRRQQVSSPTSSAQPKDSDASLARATADTFIARYREFLSVDEHERPAFDEAHAAFRAAAAEAASHVTDKALTQEQQHHAALTLCLRLYGTVALDWMRPAPKLTLISMACSQCGGKKQRADVVLCLECADIYDTVHEVDPRDFGGEG